MRALIVEDEIFSANHLKSIVERCGIEVITIVNNAQDAFKVCRKEKPELVFMDIMIKGATSGLEAAIEIKYNISDKITVIFLSAYSDREMISYALEANTFAYLLKPYREGEIVATLELYKTKLESHGKPLMCKEQNLSNSIVLLGGYTFDMEKMRLCLHNQEVSISKKSKKLLYILCKNRDIYISSSECIRYIWDDQECGSCEALRSLIYRLKREIKVPFIQNQSGVGYKIITPD